VEIIGTQGVLDNFADGTSLKIKLADVPESKRAAVITELVAVFQKHGVMDCVEKKAIIVPKPEFRRPPGPGSTPKPTAASTR